MSSLMERTGRGCTKCPAEAVVGFYFQCQNPTCKNYEPPLSMGGKKVTEEARSPWETPGRVIKIYGRWSDAKERDTKYANSQARDLIGMTARKKFNGNVKLPYGICFALRHLF